MDFIVVKGECTGFFSHSLKRTLHHNGMFWFGLRF
jgi:hypothetical protein